MTTLKAVSIYHTLVAIAAIESKTKSGVLPFSGTTRYALARLLRKVTPIQEDYEKARISLVKQFGAEDEHGNLEVQPDKFAEFSAQIKTIQETEVDVTFGPVPEKEIQDINLPFALVSNMLDLGIVNESAPDSASKRPDETG